MDDKGILFTSDVLLALIIITMVMGVTIDQFDQLNFQIQDFTGRQSLDKVVTDAADYIVKSSGNPSDWEKRGSNGNTLPGLAYMSGIGSNNNFIDPKKVSKLNENPKLISNLVHTTNYKLTITKTTGESLLVVDSPNPTTSLTNAKEVAVANRTVVVITNMTNLRMDDLMHINPSNPGTDNGFIWYNKSGDSIYVGPGNVTTEERNESSFYVTNESLNDYDFYVYIDENYATAGSPISEIKYGFTDGDVVVNGTYGDLGDKERDNAITRELNDVNNPGGWKSLPKADPGGLFLVNDDMRKALNYYNDPDGDLKFWLAVKSNPNAVLSLSLIQVNKGAAPFQKIPAKLVLTVWE